MHQKDTIKCQLPVGQKFSISQLATTSDEMTDITDSFKIASLSKKPLEAKRAWNASKWRCSFDKLHYQRTFIVLLQRNLVPNLGIFISRTRYSEYRLWIHNIPDQNKTNFEGTEE